MVVLTDGYPNSQAAAVAAADDAKNNYAVTITGVCIGCSVSNLAALVSEPSTENIIDIASFGQISSFVADLVDNICPPGKSSTLNINLV